MNFSVYVRNWPPNCASASTIWTSCWPLLQHRSSDLMLAGKLGVDSKEVLELANWADLARIKGVSNT